MPASEEERLALLSRLTETLGADAARTLMESLPPTHWDQIATKDDLRALEERLVQKFTSEVNKVKGEIHEVKSGLSEINGRVDGEFGRIDGKFANLKGELKELRGSISLEISKQTRTLVLMLCGFALTVWISLFAIGV